MKIRIKGNSLRYRLTKTEVTKLTREGYLEESTSFAAQALTYALKSTASQTLSASFEQNKITVFMPEAMITEWSDTDRVGFDGKHNQLYLLIEKDFMCLDTVAEDQSDNYPNPLATGTQ